MADLPPSSQQDRDRLAAERGPPGLTASYAGRYVPKSPDYGVSRFAYRTPYSPTAYNPPLGSLYTAYGSGPGADKSS